MGTIAEAMLSASLGSLSDYQDWMRFAGLTVTVAEDITRHVEQTWSHCARIGANPAVQFLLRFTSEHAALRPVIPIDATGVRTGSRPVRGKEIRLTA